MIMKKSVYAYMSLMGSWKEGAFLFLFILFFFSFHINTRILMGHTSLPKSAEKHHLSCVLLRELTTSSIPNTFLDSDSDSGPTCFTVHRNQSGVSAPNLPSSSRTSPPLIQPGDRTRLLRAVAMTTEKRSRHIPRGLARGFPGNSHTNPGKHPEKTLGRPPDRGITAGLVHSSGYLQEKNMTTPLPLLDDSDPRLKLTVENRIRNIFVTQSEDTR